MAQLTGSFRADQPLSGSPIILHGGESGTSEMMNEANIGDVGCPADRTLLANVQARGMAFAAAVEAVEICRMEVSSRAKASRELRYLRFGQEIAVGEAC